MNIALILSGGTGSRVGADIPKQYIEINGRPVIGYCLDTVMKHEKIDAVQIVADTAWQEFIREYMTENCFSGKFRGFSLPGENRQLSIFNGLTDIRRFALEDDLVIIHDAARPFISEIMISECLNAMPGYDGVLPVLPMKDTVYLSEDGEEVASLLDRKQIFAGQAPEVFILGTYYHANRALLPDQILQINGSTEPAVMAGMNIRMIPGDERNFKITTKADLLRFQQMVNQQ